jgi:hypothetical protein
VLDDGPGRREAAAGHGPGRGLPRPSTSRKMMMALTGGRLVSPKVSKK